MLKTSTIGMDLGTGKCCVASVQDGKVLVLPNALSDKTTPSYVAFNDTRTLVGSEAKEQATVNPENTVHSIKSLLGRKYNDPVTQKYLEYSSVKIVEEESWPSIEVLYRQGTIHASPELIAAMQLLKMKQEAESHVEDIKGAVVSVPAYFNNSQRQAIVAACNIAGLNLLDIITEPMATALTYRYNRTCKDEQTVLVFDMGASKLDVSVIRVSEEEVCVLAVCGDDAFGGDNLDRLLMEFVDEKFYTAHKMKLRDNPRSIIRLKMACEDLKRKLTQLPVFKINLECILGEIDFELAVTRKEFQKLCSEFINCQLPAILKSVLNDAKLTEDQIDEVIVVGGSSRVPCIQHSLKKFFVKKVLNCTVNADESVAHGAALLAKDIVNRTNTHDIGIREMVQDPSAIYRNDRHGFHKYLVLRPGLSFEFEQTKLFNDNTEERIKSTFTLGPFGTFRLEKFYIKPYNKQKLTNSEYLRPIVSFENMEQLRAFKRHRKDVELVETMMNDLEENCYNLRSELNSGNLECDLEVEKYINELLEWLLNSEVASAKDCEERELKLTQLWDRRMSQLAEEQKYPLQNEKVSWTSEENDSVELSGSVPEVADTHQGTDDLLHSKHDQNDFGASENEGETVVLEKPTDEANMGLAIANAEQIAIEAVPEYRRRAEDIELVRLSEQLPESPNESERICATLCNECANKFEDLEGKHKAMETSIEDLKSLVYSIEIELERFASKKDSSDIDGGASSLDTKHHSETKKGSTLESNLLSASVISDDSAFEECHKHSDAFASDSLSGPSSLPHFEENVQGRHASEVSSGPGEATSDEISESRHSVAVSSGASPKPHPDTSSVCPESTASVEEECDVSCSEHEDLLAPGDFKEVTPFRNLLLSIRNFVYVLIFGYEDQAPCPCVDPADGRSAGAPYCDEQTERSSNSHEDVPLGQDAEKLSNLENEDASSSDDGWHMFGICKIQ